MARGKPAPEAIDGGWRVQVDEPDQVARYVFPFSGEPLRRLTQSFAAPLTPIKVCASPEDVAPLLSPPWAVHHAAPIMTKPILAATDVRAVEGYSIALTGAGEVLIAFATAPSGDIAAGGRIALVEGVAVFDQIWTHQDHQRRGLGSAIMQTLENTAVNRDAQRGMLVATDVGCALYQTVGWDIYAPYTTALVPNA